MSKVTPMLYQNVDPLAVTKRVYYRPDTAADTVRVGDLVCYNWDLTSDYKERSSTPISGGTAYAEGSQNYTGRLFVVEKPATANLQFFAGVVARLGDLAGADGDLIEIYVPNGAVVPVMSDQFCTNGRTIVAVRNDAYEGSYPSSAARPIGIAMETKDRSSTDGLVWTKLDPNLFTWNYHSSSLNIDDEGTTGDHIVHKIAITSAQTGGRLTGLDVVVTSAGGAGSDGYGLAAYFQADVSAACAAHCAGVGIWMNITGGTQTKNLTALEVGLYESGANLAGAGSVVAPLTIRTNLDSTNAPAVRTHYLMYLSNDGSDNPDGLFMANDCVACGFTTKTSASCTHIIPIRFKTDSVGGGSNGVYYIMCSQAA